MENSPSSYIIAEIFPDDFAYFNAKYAPTISELIPIEKVFPSTVILLVCFTIDFMCSVSINPSILSPAEIIISPPRVCILSDSLFIAAVRFWLKSILL